MQTNQNLDSGIPNIQKLVPVKKNGFILELQIPAPNGFNSVNNVSYAQQNPPASNRNNTAFVSSSSGHNSTSQRQQVVNIPNQEQINLQDANQIEEKASSNPLSLRKLFGG